MRVWQKRRCTRSGTRRACVIATTGAARWRPATLSSASIWRRGRLAGVVWIYWLADRKRTSDGSESRAIARVDGDVVVCEVAGPKDCRAWTLLAKLHSDRAVRRV